MAAPGAPVRQRLWPSCLAAVIVLAALVFFVQPMLFAAAAPGAAGAGANPVRVRVSPASGALGGGTLRPGDPSYRPVTVHNDGRSAFRYQLGIRADGALASLVVVEFRAVEGRCDAAAFATGLPVAGPAPMDAVVAGGGRVLPAGASEALCVRVGLPGDAVVPPGATGTDAVLRVSAVQH